jgi:hypothetical protein
MTKSSSAPKPHKQVLAKVNVYVDEDIKELVEVLNTFDGVCTVDSCQGSKGEFSYITFAYGKDSHWRQRLREREFMKVARFVNKLAKHYSRLAIVENAKTRTVSDPAGIGMSLDIMMDWSGKMDVPYIKLLIPYNQIKQVTYIFCLLASEFAQHSACKQESNR